MYLIAGLIHSSNNVSYLNKTCHFVISQTANFQQEKSRYVPFLALTTTHIKTQQALYHYVQKGV